jgi:hypothetical protein
VRDTHHLSTTQGEVGTATPAASRLANLERTLTDTVVPWMDERVVLQSPSARDDLPESTALASPVNGDDMPTADQPGKKPSLWVSTTTLSRAEISVEKLVGMVDVKASHSCSTNPAGSGGWFRGGAMVTSTGKS